MVIYYFQVVGVYFCIISYFKLSNIITAHNDEKQDKNVFLCSSFPGEGAECQPELLRQIRDGDHTSYQAG